MSAMPGHTHPEIEDKVVGTIKALFKEQTAQLDGIRGQLDSIEERLALST